MSRGRSICMSSRINKIIGNHWISLCKKPAKEVFRIWGFTKPQFRRIKELSLRAESSYVKLETIMTCTRSSHLIGLVSRSPKSTAVIGGESPRVITIWQRTKTKSSLITHWARATHTSYLANRLFTRKGLTSRTSLCRSQPTSCSATRI